MEKCNNNLEGDVTTIPHSLTFVLLEKQNSISSAYKLIAFMSIEEKADTIPIGPIHGGDTVLRINGLFDVYLPSSGVEAIR